MQVVKDIYALKNQSNIRDQMLFKTLGSDSAFDGEAREYIYQEGDNQAEDGVNVVRHKNNGGNFLLIGSNGDLIKKSKFSDIALQQNMKLIFVESDETNDNTPTLYLSVNNKVFWLVMQEIN